MMVLIMNDDWRKLIARELERQYTGFNAVRAKAA
jgi:hypothetical protein